MFESKNVLNPLLFGPVEVLRHSISTPCRLAELLEIQRKKRNASGLVQKASPKGHRKSVTSFHTYNVIASPKQ